MIIITPFFRVIGLASLGATVFIAPWCFGSTDASVQVWLFPGVLLALVCALLVPLLEGIGARGEGRGTGGGGREAGISPPSPLAPHPLLILPLLLMLLLAGLQLRPLDHATFVQYSPKAAELRELLLPAPDSAEARWLQASGFGLQASEPEVRSPKPEAAPTSIYPAATRHQLSLFVLVISAFFAASVLFKDQASGFRLQASYPEARSPKPGVAIALFAAAAVVNGCALALFGIFMRLNPHIKTFYVWSNEKTGFVPFLNYNNAAGWLGMSLGFAVFFLLWGFFRTDREIEESHRWDKRFERASRTTKEDIADRFSRVLSPGILIWGLTAGILIAGILISTSRGGSIAAGTALLTVLMVVFAVRRSRLLIPGVALVGVMGVGLVCWAGMNERVQKRLETVLAGDDGARSRNWSNAIATARDFQWRGAGFGTYQYANLLNDELAAMNLIAVRAENQYVEIFLDLGPRGLFLLLACPVVAVVLCLRLILRSRDDRLTALGCGLLIVVVTQTVASLFDFGLYVTANALLLAVCCGILSAAGGCGREKERGTGDGNLSPVPLGKYPLAGRHIVFRVTGAITRCGLFATGCLLLALTWRGNKEIGNIHRIDLAMERLEQLGDSRSAPPDELSHAVAQLEEAIALRPDDATATLALAEAQIGLYRQTVYRELLAVRDLMMSDDDLWNRTSLLSVHESVGRWRRLGFTARVNAIRKHPAVEQYLRPAFANLVRSRQSNPMSVGTHLRIAQLTLLLDKDDTMKEFEQNAIRRAVTVSPFSAAAWYETGILERNLGRAADARACWKRSLSLSRLYLKPIVELTKADMRGNNAQTLFRETFPNEPDLFLTLTWHFKERDVPSFNKEALEALKESCETAEGISEGERHYWRGLYEISVGNNEAAVTELQAACATQRSNPKWRYQLARAYYSNRQFKEAEEEIQFALFYDPRNETYLKLRDDIHKAVMMW